MRLVVARCTVDYNGRLDAHLPDAVRLIMVKADGCIAVHSDGGAYKPLNWMNAPNTVDAQTDASGAGVWAVTNPKGETLTITISEVHHDSSYDLGEDPGLRKDGVEAHLQELLAAAPDSIEPGLTLVRREYPTAIGPIDLVCRDTTGIVIGTDLDHGDGEAPAAYVGVEVKRRATLESLEQLTRYLQWMNRDPHLPGGTRGILAAMAIPPQVRKEAESRGIRTLIVDYDGLRGLKKDELTLF